MLRYLQAIALCPTYAAAHYNAGVLCSELGRTDDSLSYYERSLQLNPLCVEAYCNIGYIQKSRGKIESAVENYKKALLINPNYGLAQQNIAIALNDMGTLVKDGGDVKVSCRWR